MNREALVVGINHYPLLRDGSGHPQDLIKPAADAEAIAQLLETSGNFHVQRFPEVKIEGYWQVDPHAKTKNSSINPLKEAISKLFNPQNNIPETALLFFVGNSVLDEEGGVQEGFLATSDTNPEKGKWGISLHWLSQLLQKSPVKQQIVWLDCYYQEKKINFLQTALGNIESTDNDRCFIFVSQPAEATTIQINSEHSFLTNYLLEALEPENNPNGWVTNYSLIDYLNQKLNLSIQPPVFHNSGNEIILTGEKENTENTDLTAGVCPYKGLAAFEFNDKDFKYFYGRKNLVNLLLEKVRSRNFLAVVGASGIGKSSIVKAGLLYQLKLGQRLSGSNTWPILIIRPSEHPLKNLAAAFVDYQLQTLLTPVKELSSTPLQHQQERERSPKLSIYPPPPPPIHKTKRTRIKSSLTPPPTTKNSGNENLEEGREKTNIERIIHSPLEIEELINQGASGFRQVLKNTQASRIVMVIDQFEEVFTLCSDKIERQQFFECLMGAIDRSYLGNSNASGLLLIITMGAEFLGKCFEQEYSGLARQIQSHLVTVTPMTRLELQQAIAEPAKQVGIEIHPELVEQMIIDTENYGSLPLLQYTLTELWQQSRGNQFTLNQYINLGGVKGCLEKQGYAIYHSFNARERQVAKQIFLKLVQINEDTVASCKQVLKTNLITPKQSLAIVSKVLKKIAKARLILITKFTNYQNSNQTVTVVELAHNTIINNWSQLNFWVESNREAIKQKPGMEEDAQRWLKKDRSDKYLLTGRKLSLAENLLESDPESAFVSVLAKEFLEKSINRKRFQSNFRIKSIVGLIIVLGCLSGFSLINWGVAEKDKLNAQLNALSLSAENQFTANQRFDALLTAIKAGKQLHDASEVAADIRMGVLIALQKTVYGVSKRRTIAKHTQPVNSISLSQDGEIIASASDDSTIKLWTSYGEEIATLKGHQGAVYSVSMSKNGKVLASGSQDGTVKLWSRDGKLLSTMQGHQGAVNSVNFSADGKTLASGGVDGIIKLWNLQGKQLLSIKANQDKIYSVSYGKVLASAGEDKTVKLWNAKGKQLATLKGHKERVLSVSVSPDSKTIATASWDNTVKVWGMDGKEIGTLRGHKSPVVSVNFSVDGKTIASGSSDGEIKLWTHYGREIATLKGHGTWVSSLSFSNDRLTLASASADNTIKLWSLQEQKLPILRGHTSYITAISLSKDAIATGSYDNTVKIWSREGEELATMKGHQRGIYSLSFSPDGETVASASADGTGIVWNLAGLGNATLTGHQDQVYSISYSPDGKMLATASLDKTIKLWNIRGQQLLTIPGGIDDLRSVTFSPDGQAIAAAGFGGDSQVVLKIWNLEGEELEKVEGLCSVVRKISFSADGKIIAATCSDNTVKLLTPKGQVVGILRGHQGTVNSLSFTPDGKIIATGSDDGTVKIWNLDGKELVSLEAIREGVMDVSFSPDGKMLGAVGRDRVGMLWNFDLENLLGRGCDVIHDYLQSSSDIKESDRGICEGF
ncbi:caspase family protein [Dapis sp. BLCC M126]|uniref:nSTAND1 domain-containing NTPase n=1 Tax=Dapis sp. BLCC M126 TaxID=3400189 RepID=UPI003CF7EE41